MPTAENGDVQNDPLVSPSGLFDKRRATHDNNPMRRLFNVIGGGAAALSLLLCVATCALWVRSYFATDLVVYQLRIDYVLHNYGVGYGKGYVVVGMDVATKPGPSVL